MNSLTVVVPAYNEEASLRVFLPQLISFCEANGFSLIVVNDGSSDGTADVLAHHQDSPCLQVYTHKVNRGYGGAIKTGIRNADSEFVATIDADGQHDPNDILELLSGIRKSDADMIVGSRIGQAEASLYRGIGKRVIRAFARLLMPIEIEDINSGMKIFRSELARRYIRLCPDHMAFSDIITMVFISKRNLVTEQPIHVKPRIAGTSTISTLTAVETVEEILNIVVLFNPMRIFFPISIAAIVLAFAWGIPIVLRGRGISTAAMLSFSTGVLFFCLGLLAEQLSQIRKNSVDD